MNAGSISRGALLKLALIRYTEALLLLMAMFFLPARTWAYWQAWLYLGVIFIPMAFVLFYLIKYDPELLIRRLKMREKESTQKRVVSVSIVYLLAVFLLPGFDRRFGWSDVPVWVVLAAAGLTLLGYGVIFLVFRENRYAARVVEVTEGQKVIDSGPYAIVRHPMYVGTVLMYVFSPLALGSWWATLLGLGIIPILVIRILNEEKVLAGELDGYEAYRQKVRFRLLPGVW